MIITFCGHSDFNQSSKYKSFVASFFDSLNCNEHIEFYLGGYGAFDSFALSCAKELKLIRKNVSISLITPYLSSKQSCNEYDNIIYPELENIPKLLAIIYRNRYMIDKSDIVIAFISRTFGGAYKSYLYATKQHKRIINLALN